MINYVLVERSFKKDPTWKDRASRVGAAAFGNLIFISFIVFFYSEKLFGSENTAKFFSIDFPLYGVGVGLSFVVMIISLILFSFLNKKESSRRKIK
jgi:predicted permease